MKEKLCFAVAASIVLFVSVVVGVAMLMLWPVSKFIEWEVKQ